MVHSSFGIIALFLWIFGISAVLFAAFLTVEFVHHRKTYLADGWSEEALLDDMIASGTLPRVKHVPMTVQTNANVQQAPAPKESLVQNIPLVHTAAR